ncbi:MAG: hypothetical protein LUD47_06935, partial [Clostridia bacterium]|nr:hypothetical protein [Clostridia bacterium]
DVEEMFGLTDDYWAFVLGDGFIYDNTSKIINSAAIAITQSMSQLGGIYVVSSVYGLLDISLNLNYESNLSKTYDLFGGNLELAKTDETTGTTEKNVQIVPNLYNVFVNGLANYGVNGSAFDFTTTSSKEIEISYTVGGTDLGGIVIGGTKYTVTATVTGAPIYFTYTVGEDHYTVVYSYEAAVKADGDTTGGATVSGTFEETKQLPNPPAASGDDGKDNDEDE